MSKTSLTLRNRIESPEFTNAIAKALPAQCKPERFVRIALTALTRTPKLADADQASMFAALLTLSQLGLEPDGRRAHLIPFENKKRGVTEVQLIIDYKGLIELALNSGKISYLHADVVCENDEFEYDRGQLIKHRVNFKKPRGEVYAAYAMARFKDGTEKVEVMSVEEIESIRRRSRAASSGPWVSDTNEMRKKTVVRRLSKWLPLSPEARDAIEADDDVIDLPAEPKVKLTVMPTESPQEPPLTEIPPQITEGSELERFVVGECASSFEGFRAAAAEWYPESSTWNSFSDVPADVAESIMLARAALKAKLA